MKIRYVLLLFIANLALSLRGQSQSFGIHIGDHRVGKFTQSTERSVDTITSFSTLEVRINGLNDTTYFRQNLVLREDFLGHLKSAQSEIVMKDTLGYVAFFDPDRTQVYGIEDTLVFRDTLSILGPEGIRRLSVSQLDSIGAMIRYRTFVPELKAILEIKREVRSRLVERAQKVWLVEESLEGQTLSLGKYDRDFNLLELSADSPFGAIKLKNMTSVDSIASLFLSDPYSKKIKSNTFLPDPRNIKAIELLVNFGDTTLHLTLADNSFDPVVKDSISSNEFLSESSWVGFSNPDSVNRRLRNLSMQKDAPVSKVKKLFLLSTSLSGNSRYNNIKFAQFARQVGIRSRLVQGFYYDRGAWHSHLWMDADINGEWLPFDTIGEFDLNRALRLPMAYSSGNNGWVRLDSLPFSATDTLTITVIEFLRKNHSFKIKRDNYDPVEIKENRYIHHVLGIGFNLPYDYQMIPTKNGEIISLCNSSNETLTIEQISLPGHLIDSLMIGHLLEFTVCTKADIKENKKEGLIYAIGLDRAAIAIRDDESYYIFKITSNSPQEMIDFLLQENLSLNF